jgi:hypothetical protein
MCRLEKDGLSESGEMGRAYKTLPVVELVLALRYMTEGPGP